MRGTKPKDLGRSTEDEGGGGGQRRPGGTAGGATVRGKER